MGDTPAEDLKRRLVGRINTAIAQAEKPPEPKYRRFLRRLRNRADRLVLVNQREGAAFGLELVHFDPDYLAYESTDWITFRRVLPPRAIKRSDVFVDFGCGKGRLLCYAARRPFARVVGVEISPRLAADARQALADDRNERRCQEVEVVIADARELMIPDDMTIAYLYCPFVGEVFDRWLQNVIDSLDRRPRRLRLIYNVPLLEDRILASGRFRVIRRLRGNPGETWDRVTVFESLAA